ncbi:MAG: S8 family serine peptidase [Pyrinomonadaceae bacterium]
MTVLVESLILSEGWRARSGRGVSVAIIDSGVDTSHPDLQGRLRESLEAVTTGNKVSFVASDGTDAAGHGTACAGIINKIAPEADLYSIRVLGANAAGAGMPFLAGLEYAIKRRFKIVNLSLGTTKPQYVAPLRDLLDRAYLAGCIVVAAANNLPQPSFPSVFSSSLISVVKGEMQNPYEFSFRYGDVIELVAPGINVRTAWTGGGYRQLTGNSFACPHIVGIIALLLEANPNLTPFQVKSALYEIARQNKTQG